MILVLLAQVTASPAPNTRTQEVVVIGQRLKDWRAKWTSSNGKVRCKTQKSSGDAEVDAIGCAAITACAPSFETRAVALARDKSVPPDARRKGSESLNREFGSCMTSKRDALVDELAARRAAAREQAS